MTGVLDAGSVSLDDIDGGIVEARSDAVAREIFCLLFKLLVVTG